MSRNKQQKSVVRARYSRGKKLRKKSTGKMLLALSTEIFQPNVKIKKKKESSNI